MTRVVHPAAQVEAIQVSASLDFGRKGELAIVVHAPPYAPHHTELPGKYVIIVIPNPLYRPRGPLLLRMRRTTLIPESADCLPALATIICCVTTSKGTSAHEAHERLLLGEHACRWFNSASLTDQLAKSTSSQTAHGACESCRRGCGEACSLQ